MLKLVLLVILALLAEQRSQALEENTEEHLFPPIHPNCTQSLTELLLLRQEAQLNRMSAAEEATTQVLKETLQTLVQVRDSLNALRNTAQGHTPTSEAVVECVSPFTRVGERCLLLALNKMHTWASARHFCAAYGADLAHFSDINEYVAVLGYINTINELKKSVSIWIGGSDEVEEDNWVWVTGELMPRGSPFWGTKDGYRPQPSDGRSQNCAVLWQPDQYYIHDVSCTYKSAPLCQM
ncbi:type-2 ice-structuring protein-like [Penaeus japonicus]|uniref:type-2 ice-structuring protein-like n=1 Tax=Penaeus japonicus TaxID=27405 RepID=UPI001C7127A9|nr:type-2 ice-structuring protein-like [Penaeus japonicus]XP_042883585.1 type-2 ice-structuring protein-like [Penaeus japonicus]